MKEIILEIPDDRFQFFIELMDGLGFKMSNNSTKILFTKEEYFAKIDKSIDQAQKGKTKTITKENQRTFLGL